MKLSIIVINYNTKEHTLLCIHSLLSAYKSNFQKGEFELIVVDNNSEDDFPAEFTKQFPKQPNLILIKNDKNLGFSGANNEAFKKTSGEYVFFLNSDATIKEGSFSEMITYLKSHQEIGILGTKLVNVNGTDQASAGVFYSLASVFLMLIGMERFGMVRKSPKTIAKVDWVSGGSMMVTRETFQKLGGFDTGFFMYMEDMDLCFRAKLVGVQTCFYPRTVFIHKGEGSSNRTFAVVHIYAGLVYFYKMRKSYTEYIMVKLILMLKAICLIFIGVITQNKYLKNTYSQALQAL